MPPKGPEMHCQHLPQSTPAATMATASREQHGPGSALKPPAAGSFGLVHQIKAACRSAISHTGLYFALSTYTCSHNTCRSHCAGACRRQPGKQQQHLSFVALSPPVPVNNTPPPRPDLIPSSLLVVHLAVLHTLIRNYRKRAQPQPAL
jgi:hypothetical protein